MQVSTSLYLWPDGKVYTCFVWQCPEKARCYKVTVEEALQKFPDERVREGVMRVAIARFEKGEI